MIKCDGVSDGNLGEEVVLALSLEAHESLHFPLSIVLHDCCQVVFLYNFTTCCLCKLLVLEIVS